MADGPTREEFARLYQTIDDGFRGVHSRLDVQNGRTGKLEVNHEHHRTRLEDFRARVDAMTVRIDGLDGIGDDVGHPRRRRGDHAGEGEEWSSSFSKREYALISVGFVIVTLCLKALEVLGSFVWNALVHKP